MVPAFHLLKRDIQAVGVARERRRDVEVPGGASPTRMPCPLGRVAQWESARFTRERSQVRNPPRPSSEGPASVGLSSLMGSLDCGAFALGFGSPVPIGAQSTPLTRASGDLPSGLLRLRPVERIWPLAYSRRRSAPFRPERKRSRASQR